MVATTQKPSRTLKTSGKDIKYKKPSSAPKRFKSAYMFFSERKHKELRKTDECKKMRTSDVAKLVSQAWKALACNDKEVFLEMAKKDKERYEIEKANYKGPWKVIDIKDRNTPKRPMSAFLAFSNARRKEVSESNPMLTNGEISKILSDMWRDAPPQQKLIYHDQENKLRLNYKMSVSKGQSTCKIAPSFSGIDCVSLSSASNEHSRQNTQIDDDNRSPGSFASMLESLNDYALSDEMSNSSRGHSVSDQTAKVSLLEEDLSPMTLDSPGRSFGYNQTCASHGYVMELPDLVAPFPLEPLIVTDFGGFLAAAALLDSCAAQQLQF
mmetsp:Transcript_9128/g.18354  ORF Transcript_9128/g.18354 Transcript_9128/m.18354 type:complete len:325 (-) Transcript_9128:471-1445(-)